MSTYIPQWKVGVGLVVVILLLVGVSYYVNRPSLRDYPTVRVTEDSPGWDLPP